MDSAKAATLRAQCHYLHGILVKMRGMRFDKISLLDRAVILRRLEKCQVELGVT